VKLDSSHLELLGALATHPTMTEASEAINLSTSAASRRLREAERRLGVELVSLDGRSLRLTAAGRLLAETALRTSREVDEAEFAARWLGSGGRAPTRVGVGFFDQLAWMLPSVDEHPFEIVRSPTPKAQDADDADVVIDVVGAGQTRQTALFSDELAFVTGLEHRLASHSVIRASDIGDHRYLASRPDPLPGFEFEALFLPSGHGPNSIMRVESFSTLVALAANGSGVSIQPRRAIEQLKRTDLRVIKLDREIVVHWHAIVDETPSPEVEAFVAALPQ
jgi:LysR family transcriptional regulator for metE and metH